MSIYKGNSLVAGGSQVLPLLTFIWSDCIKNHPSWLNATTFSWQSGAVYQAAYQHLVDDYNNTGEHLYGWSTDTFSKTPYPSVGDVLYRSDGTEWSTVAFVASNYSYIIRSDGVAQLNRNTSIDTVLYDTQTETIAGVTVSFYRAADGHKICLADQESNVASIYSATGVAWYYILDTVNQRFKLPRTKFGFTGIRSGVGDYVEAGLPNITGSSYGYVSSASRGASGALQMSGGSSKDATGGGGWWVEGVTVSVNASNSSSVYGNSDTVQPKATEMYLYFYVGNFTQTAIENTAGLNTELFNQKVDLNLSNTASNIDFVVESQEPTVANNYTWYRKYKSGWVEQGGLYYTTGNAAGAYNISFLVPFANTNYQSLLSVLHDADGGSPNDISEVFPSRTTTTMRIYIRSGWHGYVWQVSGMAAN